MSQIQTFEQFEAERRQRVKRCHLAADSGDVECLEKVKPQLNAFACGIHPDDRRNHYLAVGLDAYRVISLMWTEGWKGEKWHFGLMFSTPVVFDPELESNELVFRPSGVKA